MKLEIKDEIKECNSNLEQLNRRAQRVLDQAEVAQEYLGRSIEELKIVLLNEKREERFWENVDQAYAVEVGK